MAAKSPKPGNSESRGNAGHAVSPLAVCDVAHQLNVSPDVVRDLLGRKVLRGNKVGGQWRIWPEDLADYIMRTFEQR